MKRKGTTLIELLTAIVIITVGFVAAMRTIVTISRQTRILSHKNEARLIAERHIRVSEHKARSDFLNVTSQPWAYENNDSVYTQLGTKLTRQYFVKEDVKYVVIDTTYSSTNTASYKTRDMIDTDNDGKDDYTGQGYDMKKITVTVAWPEIMGQVSVQQMILALKNNDKTFFKKKRIHFYTLSTVISSFDPQDFTCCYMPKITSFSITDESGNDVNFQENALNTSKNYIALVGIDDQCNAKILNVFLYYWYYGQGEGSAKKVRMESASGGYYQYHISSDILKNADVDSGYDEDVTCAETSPGEEPFDIHFKVYVEDEYIGKNCGDINDRFTYSDVYNANIKDDTGPDISDFTLERSKCTAIIKAKISDGANGIEGVDHVEASYAEMDGTGNHGSLKSDFVSQSGPDESGLYSWEIPSNEIQNWSGGGGTDFDDLPDLYYTITAYDKCGNTTTIPAEGNDQKTEVTFTKEDSNPPEIVYDNDAFENCVEYSDSSQINIDFTVQDDCMVTTAAYIAIPGEIAENMNSSTDLSSYTHVFNINDTYKEIKDQITPTSRDDIYFKIEAHDDSGNVAYDPESGYMHIHQGNALYFMNPNSDPKISGDVSLEGTDSDTVVLDLKNYRNGDIYLGGLTITEPVYKTICLSNGDTSVAFPYIDRVTLETIPDSGTAEKHIIWDWQNDYPTPGSRERAPVDLQFDTSNSANLWIQPKEHVKLYLHFMDKENDNDYPAQPFSMIQCNFDITLHSDESKDYKCDNHYVFDTYQPDYNNPPHAELKDEELEVYVGKQLLLDGTPSYDCEDKRNNLSYTWDFGDGETAGPLQGESTIYHTYTQDDYNNLWDGTYGSNYAGAIVRLTITDSEGATDSDTCLVKIKSKGSPPHIDSFTCSASGDKVDFSVRVSDPDDSTFHYVVDYGDNQNQDFPNQTGALDINHVYDRYGDYTVTVIVSDAAGNTDSATTSVSCSGYWSVKCKCNN